MKLEGVINSCVKASCYFLDTGTTDTQPGTH